MANNQSRKSVEQFAAKRSRGAALAPVRAEAQVCRTEQYLGHVSLRRVKSHPQAVGQQLLYDGAMVTDPLHDFHRITRGFRVHALG